LPARSSELTLSLLVAAGGGARVSPTTCRAASACYKTATGAPRGWIRALIHHAAFGTRLARARIPV